MGMSRGKTSAVAVVLAAMVIFHGGATEAAPTFYTVGDDRGWTTNVTGWTEGKNFKAGDYLVFNYDNRNDKVVIVSRASDYDSCSTAHGGLVYEQGDDHLKLDKGVTYFISDVPWHCEAGMKIAVSAT